MIDEVKGIQFGVRLEPRGKDDKHVCIQIIISEDDEQWHPHGSSFSSFWIKDLIRVLQLAQAELRRSAVKDSEGFGFEFKE